MRNRVPQLASLIFLCCVVFLLRDNSVSQTASSPQATHGGPVTLTGILLVSDYRCEQRRTSTPQNALECPDGLSDWSLLIGSKVYPIQANAEELKKYERHRIMATGTFEGNLLKLQAIEQNDLSDAAIRALVQQLKSVHWIGPQNISVPMDWLFNFTSPMMEVLQAGPVAQEVLLQYLDDPEIKDQIIILLGGIGDEKAIGPIIDAMPGREGSANARKINLVANLALTNITVSEVIWHHGGGIPIEKCPNDPKSCWSDWWAKSKESFSMASRPNRNYSNYPNYGIYRQP